MVGKHQIQIDSTEFHQGLATSDYMPDGGIGTSSYNLSLIAEPGIVRAMPHTSPEQGGGAISSGIVASCESPETPLTKNYRWFVDSGGNIFKCSDSGYENDTLGTISGTNDVTTNMAVWLGPTPSTYSYIYVTKTTDIVRLRIENSSGDLSAISDSWFSDLTGASSLTSGVPHPLLVFEGSLWVGDNNVLRSASGEATLGNTLTLNANERITCLAIDPQTGLMMIGVHTVSDADDRYPGQSFVYLFDGYSAKARRKTPVDGVLESFHPVGGSVFAGMNNTIGIWNGSGISFLRRLYNTSQSSHTLPYKNRVASFQNTFLVTDGPNILAYGDIGNGKKVWWPFYKHTDDIDSIFSMGNTADSSFSPADSRIAVNSGSTLVYVHPMDVSTAAEGVYSSSYINFERPVNIRGMEVFTTGITTTTGIGEVALIDEEETVTKPTVSKFVVASGTRRKFHFDFNKKLQSLQPKITIDTQAFGIIRLVIYYDVAE